MTSQGELSTDQLTVFGGTPVDRRPLWQSMRRGFAGRCPNCGQGKLFGGFTKVVDQCGHCGEELHHHRADDLPAYLNIFIVGHVVVAGFLLVERAVLLPHWLHLAIWVPVTLLMAFVLMQPIKGAVVGLQWANKMHGFSGISDDVADPDIDPKDHG